MEEGSWDQGKDITIKWTKFFSSTPSFSQYWDFSRDNFPVIKDGAYVIN